MDAARDKSETRASMARAGLPTPRNRLIERPDQVEAAGQHVGFPAGEGLQAQWLRGLELYLTHSMHSLVAAGSGVTRNVLSQLFVWATAVWRHEGMPAGGD